MNLKLKINAKLIAPCGMDCGACMVYLREKNKCPGCRYLNKDKPITRIQCKIRTCKTFQNEKAKFCFQCKDFPCDNLKHLDKRYREKYHMSQIENLLNIRSFGLKKFIKSENVRWTCSKCKGAICVHRGYCIQCGKKN